MSDVERMHDDYAFQFLNDLPGALLQTLAIGRQKQIDGSYNWDNSQRYDCYLLQYTLGGSGTIEIDGEKHLLTAGQGFFLHLPCDTRYYFDEQANEAPWDLIYLMFTGTNIAPYCRQIEKQLGSVFELPLYSTPVQLFLDLHAKAAAGFFKNPYVLNSQVFELLSLLCVQDHRPVDEQSLAFRARDYLDRHYHDSSAGLLECSSALSVSQSHLSREFHRQFSEKPVEYLTRLRLKEAVRLLNATNETLAEISAQAGFSSANYFAKVFRKYLHMTPTEFRSRIRTEGYVSIQL